MRTFCWWVLSALQEPRIRLLSLIGARRDDLRPRHLRMVIQVGHKPKLERIDAGKVAEVIQRESVRSELGVQLSGGACRYHLGDMACDEILHLRHGVLGSHTSEDHGEPARRRLHTTGEVLERLIRRQPRVSRDRND